MQKLKVTSIRIVELTEKVENRILEQDYAKAYRESLLRILNEFRKFTEDYKSEQYSTNIGEKFLNYLFSSDKALYYQRQGHRVVEMINRTYLHGTFEKRQSSTCLPWPTQFSDVLENYCLYRSRTVCKSGVLQIRHIMYDFASFLVARGVSDICQLKAEDIEAFVLTFTGLASTATRVRNYELKHFCAYLLDLEMIDVSVFNACPQMRYYDSPKIPMTFSPDMIAKLIGAVDCNNPVGKRDYAILLLIAKTGLRASDVKNLEFKNLNWANSTIELTQHKTGVALSLPLTNDVGSAIIDYLKNGRPTTDSPNIFVKHVRPYDAIETPLHLIVKKYMHIAKIPMKHGCAYGTHILRHSLATILLEKEIPYTTIAEVLGHVVNSDATKRYMTIDMTQLKNCALEV